MAPPEEPGRTNATVYGVVVLLSAFLLFGVQPMAGKALLPRLGGVPSAWTTCLLFFQAALLAGYGYVWLSSRWSTRVQVAVHIVLVGLAVAAPTFAPTETGLTGHPVSYALAFLLSNVGLQFTVLSATSPLLQSWFAAASGRRPYFLYAVSNIGSLAALAAYPFIIEPWLGLHQQAVGFRAGLCLVAGGLLLAGRSLLVASRKAPAKSWGDDVAPLSKKRRARWVLWAFVPSSLLAGATSYVSLDLAPMPLLWVLPLGLYLLSFILAFSERVGAPPGWLTRAANLVAIILVLASAIHANDPVWLLALLHFGFLFIAGWIAHARLAQDAPPAESLPEFFVWTAFGGVCGTLVSVVLAPALFNDLYEYPLVIALACAIAVPLSRSKASPSDTSPSDTSPSDTSSSDTSPSNTSSSDTSSSDTSPSDTSPSDTSSSDTSSSDTSPSDTSPSNTSPERAEPYDTPPMPVDLAYATVVGAALLVTAWGALYLGLHPRLMAVLALGPAAVLAYRVSDRPRRYALSLVALVWAGTVMPSATVTRLSERSFFGVARVVDDGPNRLLLHGSTLHGIQGLDERDECVPRAYYAQTRPLGSAFEAFRTRPRSGSVFAIGLGAGAIACYGESGESWHFVEIDQSVAEIAEDSNWFTFLSNASADVEVEIADGRQALESVPDASLDMLVIDAFNSDAVPLHLLTREALTLYMRRLRSSGWAVLHISSRSLDLEGVLSNALASIQDEFPDCVARVASYGAATWVVLATDEQAIEALDERWTPLAMGDAQLAWTDSFSSLWSAVDLSRL